MRRSGATRPSAGPSRRSRASPRYSPPPPTSTSRPRTHLAASGAPELATRGQCRAQPRDLEGQNSPPSGVCPAECLAEAHGSRDRRVRPLVPHLPRGVHRLRGRATPELTAGRRARPGLPRRPADRGRADHRELPAASGRSIVDLALEALLTEYGGTRRGIRGADRGPRRDLHRLPDPRIRSSALGPVPYERRPTGPDSDRRVVVLGLGRDPHRRRAAGLAAADAAARVRPGPLHPRAAVPGPPTADRFLAPVRERMAELSILRGQVISFACRRLRLPRSRRRPHLPAPAGGHRGPR